MYLKIKCHSKCNFTQKGRSPCNVTQMECHLNLNVTHNGMLLKMECHSKWNVTQNGMIPEM